MISLLHEVDFSPLYSLTSFIVGCKQSFLHSSLNSPPQLQSFWRFGHLFGCCSPDGLFIDDRFSQASALKWLHILHKHFKSGWLNGSTSCGCKTHLNHQLSSTWQVEQCSKLMCFFSIHFASWPNISVSSVQRTTCSRSADIGKTLRHTFNY